MVQEAVTKAIPKKKKCKKAKWLPEEALQMTPVKEWQSPPWTLFKGVEASCWTQGPLQWGLAWDQEIRLNFNFNKGKWEFKMKDQSGFSG